MVERKWVEGADDNERDDEAQDRLVEGVPVHVFRPFQGHYTHLKMLPALHLCIHHDWDGEEEAAHPHQHVDDDGPLDGPPLWCRMNNSNVSKERNSLF